MSLRSWVGWLSLVAGALAACGQTSESAPIPAAAGTAGAAGAADGEVACNRGNDCTIAVTVNDETAGHCATKADGRSRCWKDGTAVENTLPAAHYRRVELAASGLVGLTAEGTIVTAPPTLSIAGVADFRATNMWGYPAICALATDESFTIHLTSDASSAPLDPEFMQRRPVPGAFTRALCAFEGLAAGVRTDGSLYVNAGTALAGTDFRELALSLHLFCAIRRDGSLTCGHGYSEQRCDPVIPGRCESYPLPSFAGSGWVDVAVTFSVACALRTSGELSCLRADGVELLADSGPYAAVEAGRSVVCALRRDGTTACFRHENETWNYAEVTALTPISLDPGW